MQNHKLLHFLTVLYLVAFATTAFAGPPALPTPKPSAPVEKAKPSPAPAANAPEAVLRRFLIALLTQDSKTLRATIVPVSDADFAYLANGETPTGVDRVKAEFEKLPITTLKAGDTVALPGGRTAIFPAKGIGPDRALLQPKNFPLPFLVQKIDGAWKVNAAPLIGSRKSAAGVQVPPPTSKP